MSYSKKLKINVQQCQNRTEGQTAKAKFYYHNREALSQQTINLVKVLGEYELIDRTGSYKPSIVFKPIEQDAFDGENKFDGGTQA